MRFIPDSNDPYSIRSFVYIGAPTNFTDGQQMTVLADGITISPSATTATTFGGLASRGLLLPGDQITLGGAATSGATYNSIAPNPVTTAPVWQVSTVYPLGTLVQPAPSNGHTYVSTTAGTSGAGQPAWPTGTGATVPDNTVVWTEFSWTFTKKFGGTSPTTYTVQLAPVPLPSEQPRNLPQNIVIDLRTSVLPQNWPGPPTAASTFDVLFSPAGTVIGPVAAAGRVHFVLADVADTGGSALTSSLATPAYNRFQLNAPWLPGTQYVVGNVVVPTPSSFIGYRCTVAGTSAASAAGGIRHSDAKPNVHRQRSHLAIVREEVEPDHVLGHGDRSGHDAPGRRLHDAQLSIRNAARCITGYDSFRFAEIGEVTQ